MAKRQSTLKKKVSKRQTRKFSKKGGRKSMKKPASKQRKIKLGGQPFSEYLTEQDKAIKKSTVFQKQLKKVNTEESKRIYGHLSQLNQDSASYLHYIKMGKKWNFIDWKFKVQANRLSPDYPWLNLVMSGIGKVKTIEIKASDNGVGGLYYTLDANHINKIEGFLREQPTDYLKGDVDVFINNVKDKFEVPSDIPSGISSVKIGKKKKKKEKR